jgi:hypothetical protein
MIQKLDMFSHLSERRETSDLLGPCEIANTNRIRVSLSSPEGGNRFSFRNIVFSTYSEFQMMDRVHELCDSDM